MAAPENILLIRLKSIGDVVLTLPAVHAVRDHFPDARLHFLVSRENASIVRGFADVDEIIPLHRDVFRSGNPIAIASNAVKLVRDLRQKRFSHVIDFQGYGETAWFSWLSGAPERWGRVHRPARAWAYTHGLATDDRMQIADWNLGLLQAGGLPIGRIRNEFVLPPEAKADARQFFQDHQLVPGKPTLFIQALTSSRKKNWPLEHYLLLAEHSRQRGVQVLFGGGPADRDALEPARKAGFVVATGVPLLVAGGLTELSTVVTGGITGLLHLAVALQKRTVMLVGCPEREPGLPYQHRDWAVTSAPGALVSTIPAEAVIDATEKAFAEAGLGR